MLSDRQAGTLIKHYSCNIKYTLICEIYEGGHYCRQVLCCQTGYLFPSILFQFPTHTSADLPVEYRSPSPSIEHLYIIEVVTCRPAYLFPSIFFPIPTHPSADLLDEYRSHSSSIEHFSILIVLRCRPANLPTYSPAYFPHFLLMQVPTC